jgi:hypothetical protein
VGLLLTLALLSTGCAALTPRPSRGMGLRYTPSEAAPLDSATAPGKEVANASPGNVGTVEAAPSGVAEPARQSAPQARQALLAAVLDVSGSTLRLSEELSRLKASEAGIAGKVSGVFLRYVEYGDNQLRWIDGELAAASRLSHTALEVEDPEMQLALLRLAGPRLEAALLGSLLLAAWVDFLNLADVMLQQCPSCGKETLLRQLERWQKLLEPAMTALASLEPRQVEAAAADLPALIGHLTREFAASREALYVAGENLEKMLVLKESIEALTLLSAMKMALPRLLLPSAPATLGVGLAAGSNGVMMGTQVVVSAEWVEMMRRLVRAGVLCLPAVSAAVRIRAGQVLMAQAHDELPRGVREALGDGPEVRGMRVTGRAGAGMAEPPRHHILPREHREWFEKRGFTGDMDIDQFCIKMDQASHQAIHGGGNWKLGRAWPGEWNRMLMEALHDAETTAGRILTRNEVLDIVAGRMKEYRIPLNFIRWRG